MAHNGRFGPYVKCGEETRACRPSFRRWTSRCEQALELLAQPKKMRRGFGAPKEPLKVFGESPVTKQPVQLLEGRYGLYVTDGEPTPRCPRGARWRN